MLLAHLVEAFGFPGRSRALLSNIQVALFSCWVACLCLLRLEVRMAWVVGRPRRHDLLLPYCFRPVSDPFKQEFMHGAGPYDVDVGDTTEDDIWSETWQSTWHYSSHSSCFLLLLHAIAPLHCRGVKSKMHVAFPRGRRYCRGVFTLPVMRLEVRMGRRSAGWACWFQKRFQTTTYRWDSRPTKNVHAFRSITLESPLCSCPQLGLGCQVATVVLPGPKQTDTRGFW